MKLGALYVREDIAEIFSESKKNYKSYVKSLIEIVRKECETFEEAKRFIIKLNEDVTYAKDELAIKIIRDAFFEIKKEHKHLGLWQ